MSWILTYFKAAWTFFWANRDLIEKHVAWLKAEIADYKAEQAIKAADAANQKLLESTPEPPETKESDV